MQDWQQVAEQLRSHGVPCDPGRVPRTVGGGGTRTAWRARAGNDDVFLKRGPLEARHMFEAEAAGLRELLAVHAVRVPGVLACVSTAASSVLALEWLDLVPPDGAANRAFGRQLADLHRHRNDRYGWHRDNAIGTTPQPNRYADDWVEFFRRERLQHQLDIAAANGHNDELQGEGRRLARHVHRLFDGYRPDASLLHGDLWGGNWAAANGVPAIFDPATYYGDRESDLAMTRLFGGFDAGFYDAYDRCWPLAEGNEARACLYQLYHVLNHLNMFGAAYRGRAVAMIRKLRKVTGG